MVASPDNFLDGLLNQVKSLFNSGNSFNQPAPAAPKPGSENAVPSSDAGGYHSPLHGSWHSSGGFTYQPNPTHPKGHMGVDMRASAGTPIYPMAPGVVSNVGTDPMGGNVVNVTHANGVRSYYAHMATVVVHKGDKVTTDTVLGSVGNTGNASHTFPHLHFQVWKDGQIQDPSKFFSVPKYTNLGKEEKMWSSDKAKQEAEAFNMKEHLSSRRVAFTNNVDQLLKVAAEFKKLAKSR